MSEKLFPTFALMQYGGVGSRTVLSMIEELSLGKVTWAISPHPGDAAVDRARSVIATQFLEGSSNVLVMVDHDIAWRRGDALFIAQKAMETKGIVGGLYSKRVPNKGFAGRFGDANKYDADAELVELGDNGMVGGGFMAIHRSVLEAVASKCKLPLVRSGFVPFFLPVIVDTGEPRLEYLSEDWAICHRAREAGKKVYVTLKPKLAHIGDFPYTLETSGRMKDGKVFDKE